MSALANERGRGVHAALFFLILALGLALRFWELDKRSLWHDEGHSLAFVRLPAREMTRALAFDDHPPLYYWALRAWMAAGEGVGWGRLFSALCSFATLPVAYALARGLAGRGAALGAMALLAVSPQAVYYGQELRMYALQSLFTTAMMALGLAALRRPSAARIGSTIVFGVLACYTHYFSALFLLGFLAVLPWAGREGEPDAGRGAVRAALGAVLAAALYLPWLPTAMSHVLVNSLRGLKAAAPAPSPDVAFLERALETSLGFVPAFPFDSWVLASPGALSQVRHWTAMVFSGALLAFFLLGLLRLRCEPRAKAFLAAFLVIPWLLAAAFQACGGRFYPRFVVPMLPLGFACAAAGIGAFAQRWRRWGAAAAVAMGAVMLASTTAMLGSDIRDVSRDMAAELARLRAEFRGRPAGGAPVLHAQAHSFWTLMGYDPTPGRHRFLAGPQTPALARLMYGRAVQIRPAELAHYDELWVAYSEWGPGPPQLRRRIEPLWFGEGWRVDLSVAAARYNKRMQLVLYSRIQRK